MKYLILALVILSPTTLAESLQINVTWDAPTEFENGEPLAATHIANYSLHYTVVGGNLDLNEAVDTAGPIESHLIVISGVEVTELYTVRVSVRVNGNGVPASDWSPYVEFVGSPKVRINAVVTPSLTVGCEPSCIMEEVQLE